MSEPIGFIGLGHLGLPVAKNLVDTGYAVTVYNRTAAKAEPLVACGVRVAAQPADTFTPGGIVATLVWDDAALESVVMSDGFLERLGPDGIHISMSTVLPATSRRLAALHAENGSHFVAAPIFGAPPAAIARQLWIPLSGPQATKERVRPLLEAMGAQGIFDFGEDVGAATTVKIVGNYLIVSAGHSMQEALELARESGVDPTAVVGMLTTTLFNAPIYQSYGRRIAEGGLAFGQSRIPQKDIGLFLQIAQQVGSTAPIAHLLSKSLNGHNGGQA